MRWWGVGAVAALRGVEAEARICWRADYQAENISVISEGLLGLMAKGGA